ncbi:hypothetical protein AGMMS50255_7850 [Spirochaetia bacterium]|nr:hypothetical protein AGMMS50255_7850 [Spirochaetia bacterium]
MWVEQKLTAHNIRYVQLKPEIYEEICHILAARRKNRSKYA